MHRRALLQLLLASMARAVSRAQTGTSYDVVIYGGTAAAIAAAVQASRMGRSVIVVSPDRHLGGLSSGGLGFTDTGDKSVIGGLAREFYHRVWQHYQRSDTWRWERREDFGNKGQGTSAIDGEARTMWIFEPHVAEQVFEDFVREHRLLVVRDEWLDRTAGVSKTGTRITTIRTQSGRTYAGRMFIDATYEGDLMAAAGVSYTVGRESTTLYGERWNGVQTGVLHHRHHFGVLSQPISPYVVAADPGSGVLPRVSTAPPGPYGAGDNKVQAYCYRLCLTDREENRLPFPKPDGYDPVQYELLLRIFNAGWRETFDKFDRIPNRKTDTNNHGPFSMDNIGMSYDYPEASYERRREILREHEQYQKGLLYFIAQDPRVPKDVQAAFRAWGLALDEFADNGHWPHQIYVREARRMVGAYVMTEHELLKRRATPDRFAQRAALHHAGRLRAERGRHRRIDERPVPDRLRLARAEKGSGRQPAGSCVRIELAHRLRQHPHGARIHDSGSVSRDGGGPGHRREHQRAGCAVRAPEGAAAARSAGAGAVENIGVTGS
jgi:FAD dependent oxidoreductase